MRIISGSKKGHAILSYRNKGIRPLTDKNRETIFNILLHGKELIGSGFNIANAVILDLFSGTGSFSFEALSRGAKEVIFFEIIEALCRDENIEIRGFGKYKTIKRTARVGRNPKNAQAIQIPEKKAIRWKMSKILFNRLNNNLVN